MAQYNNFQKQVAENEKKARQNLQERDEQLAQLQAELQQVKKNAEEQARSVEERARNAVGAKENELSALMQEHREIREQRAIALKAAADKEMEIVQAMQAQEEAQRVADEAQKAAAEADEIRKKAEDDKNRALNSLMLEDYMRGGAGPSGRFGNSPPPKREFSNLGLLIKTPDGCSQNDMDGVRFLRDVKPNMREKILSEFVSMGDILYDTAAVKNLSKEEDLDMRSQEYLSHNVPPPTNIKSKLELFKRLFYFASYYLQQYPTKVVSFLDYLLYLMEQATLLSVAELVDLDHKMRMDFYVHPEWNWAQHRNETRCTIDRVMTPVTVAALKSNPKPFNTHFNKFGNGFTSHSKGPSFSAPKSKSGGTFSGKVKKSQKQKVTEDMVKNEICVSWNSGRCAIPPPKKCWRKHVCINPSCGGDHKIIDCPLSKK